MAYFLVLLFGPSFEEGGFVCFCKQYSSWSEKKLPPGDLSITLKDSKLQLWFLVNFAAK